MNPAVFVSCPIDGDMHVPATSVLVDVERHLVAFSCPGCLDLVRHRCPVEATVALERTLRCGGTPANLGPRRREDVCDGRPWTSTEAFELHCELGGLG